MLKKSIHPATAFKVKVDVSELEFDKFFQQITKNQKISLTKYFRWNKMQL